MQDKHIPPQAMAAFFPHSKHVPQFQHWNLEKGLYIFPGFLQNPGRQEEILHHELTHGVDPKIEIKKHQDDTIQYLGNPWKSEAEIDAIIGPTIQRVVNKAQNNPKYLQKIKTALRTGNVKQIDSYFARAPKELTRAILIKTYNAMADEGLLSTIP